MKRIIALVCVALMLCTFALGEEAQQKALNWEEIEDQVIAAGFEGAFYNISGTPLEMWLPDGYFTDEPLSQEDVDNGFLCYLTEDIGDGNKAIVSVEVADPMSAQEYAEAVTDMEGFELVDAFLLNGLPAVLYSIPEKDMSCVAICLEDDHIYIFGFRPVSYSGYGQFVNVMVASIMPQQ